MGGRRRQGHPLWLDLDPFRRPHPAVCTDGQGPSQTLAKTALLPIRGGTHRKQTTKGLPDIRRLSCSRLLGPGWTQ